MSRYPFIDRNPCLRAAGKPSGDSCVTAKDLLNVFGTDEKIEVIRKNYGMLEPEDHGPERKGVTYYGVFTEIEHCLREPEKSHFQHMEYELKNTIYDSYWNKALGKSRDPTPGLPRGMNIECTTFGTPTPQLERIAEIVHPLKTPGQVLYEDKAHHDLYRFSHNNYYPGEMINRSYNPPFNKCDTFGCPTHSDYSGSKTKTVLTWFNNDPISKVSRRQAAVKERTSAPIGQTLDKTGVSSKFDWTHTFGKPSEQNQDGVAELLNEFTPSAVRSDVREYISYANKLRRKIHNIINKGEIMLEDLFDEFSNLDKEKTFSVHFDCIDKICHKYHIHLDRNKIEPLLLLLGILKPDGTIRYREFLDFLDSNRNFPPLKREHYVMPPEYQKYDRDSYVEEKYCVCKTHLSPPAGKASIPTRPSPYYQDSIVDIESLGTETTARAVIYPSIYTQYGLTHRDFFRPRTKEFLSDLFKRIGCTLSAEDVDEIYAEESVNVKKTIE
ncbi:UNVERIFIED_CONTAM: hypothetical protein PYX00_006659 [Menopon gallinae]|uniref:EFHB C-terminal EF-hand domain-containing protein n=1 Tax=Menopon gallinae TaxID=328185 RepID=A0AAW2HX32_9NEOP